MGVETKLLKKREMASKVETLLIGDEVFIRDNQDSASGWPGYSA